MASVTAGWSSNCFTTSNPSLAMLTCCKYRFTSLILVSFLEGLVPWERCAYTQRRSLSSRCAANHADREVKGNLVTPDVMSDTSVLSTTDFSAAAMNVHT